MDGCRREKCDTHRYFNRAIVEKFAFYRFMRVMKFRWSTLMQAVEVR